MLTIEETVGNVETMLERSYIDQKSSLIGTNLEIHAIGYRKGKVAGSIERSPGNDSHRKDTRIAIRR